MQGPAYILNMLFFFSKAMFFEAYRLTKFKILSSLGITQLHSLFLSLTYECNLNCIHCFEKFQDYKNSTYLSTEKIKDIIDQFYGLGGCKIYFCSGEVVLRDDIFELIKYARSKRIITSITSNGTLLTESKLRDLKEVGLNNLIISIDSADPIEHDKLRGMPGCFDKATTALRLAKK